MFHKFGDTLVETIMEREPFTMAYIAYGKFVLRIDEFGRLHKFGGCWIAEATRSKYGVVRLIWVNSLIEVATEGDTIVRVVLTQASVSVISLPNSCFEVAL